jgi:hypothetical protein
MFANSRQPKLKPIIIEEEYYKGKIMAIRYQFVIPEELTTYKKIYKCPKHISIENINNISQLTIIEKQYETFIEKNIQSLLLNDTIHDYLDIRDAIIFKISKLKRDKKIRENMIIYNALQRQENMKENIKDNINIIF